MSMCVFFCFAVENLSFESVLNLDDATVLNFSPNYSIKSTTIYTILMHFYFYFLFCLQQYPKVCTDIDTKHLSHKRTHACTHSHTYTRIQSQYTFQHSSQHELLTHITTKDHTKQPFHKCSMLIQNLSHLSSKHHSVPQLLLKASCFTSPQTNTAMKSKSSPAVHAASHCICYMCVCVRHFNDHHPFYAL